MIKKNIYKFSIILLLVFTAGSTLIWWIAQSTDKRMKSILLDQARITAMSVNINRIIALSGSAKDINTPDYTRVKSQLMLMRNAKYQCRFLYLLGQRPDGQVFFFLDSLPVDSKDYASPGLIYDEVSDSYLRVFATMQEDVVGPITDRWGTLITALIPIKHPDTGDLIAVLGMDIDAANWNKTILLRCAFPITTCLLVAILILTLISRNLINKAQLEREKRHRLFFEKSPLGIIHYNHEGIITDVNEAMINTFGSSYEKLVGLDIDDIPDKKFFKEVNRSLDGEPGHFEGKYISHTGKKTSYIKADWIPIKKENAMIAGIGIIEDITERKQAEKKLQLQALVLDQIKDHVVITDLSGVIIYINNVQERTLGYSKDECIGRTTEVWGDDPEQGATQKKIVRDTLQNGSWRGEVVNYAKDGCEIILDCRTQIINDNEGNPISICGISTDITERKRAEDKIKESEKQYRNLFNSITDLIYTQDLEGRFTSVNPAMYKLFGYEIEEFLGHRASEFMESDLQSGFAARYLEVIKKHEYLEGVGCYLNKNKEKLYLEYRSSLVKQNGEEPYISGVARDMTEKIVSQKKVEKLQEQVAQAQKMESIGTLAGGISHDLNNILFPIIGHAEMLLMDVPVDSPFKNGLNQIYTGALRASDLVKQILTFSRKENSEFKLMNMQPVVKEVLKLIRSTIPTTIMVKQNIHDCGVIKADPTQIHQIVMNLCTNAYHAMENTGGELKISLKKVEFKEPDLLNPDIKPGTYACLSISDTGKGMDKELTEKIFDPFFTTKEVGKGTGMGLSVVYGIIKNMDGAIKVYSEPDKGTEFHVYLPLAEAVKEQQESHAKTLIRGGTERILLVDDEDAIVTIEKLMLERLGYQVTSRTSSIEALEAFRDNPDKFDLVITDMAMPNMSGDKLSVELNKILPGVPVLLCTGFSETMSEEKAASMGIKGFLLKPIVIKDLSNKIHEVLGENKS